MAGAPLNLRPDHIDDLVRQAGNILVAKVNGDAGLLLLELARCRLGGGPDVAARVLEGGLGEDHHLVVRDGRRRVVAHCERGRRQPRGAGAGGVAVMVVCWRGQRPCTK